MIKHEGVYEEGGEDKEKRGWDVVKDGSLKITLVLRRTKITLLFSSGE